MGATGAQLCIDQTKALKALEARHDGVGNLPLSLNLDPAFASLGGPFGERQPDVLPGIDPVTLNQG